MLKSLWFMAKILVLVAVTLWLAQLPGSVEASWGSYTLSIKMGAFLAVAFVALLVILTLYRIVLAVLSLPKILTRRKEARAREKGLQALTIGLSAVAAGDTAQAKRQSQRVLKYWPQQRGLPDLLAAQVARMEGRGAAAQVHFHTLLESEDTAFLGVRGLLQSALEGHDEKAALSMARKALNLYPKQPWVLQLVYDLEVKAANWRQAQDVLKSAIRYGAIEKEKADSDQVAMLLLRTDQALAAEAFDAAMSHAKEALKIDPLFAPAVARVASLYNANKQFAKAGKVLEKAWREAPHPDMVVPFLAAITPKKAQDPMARIKRAERLIKLNAASIESYLAAAQICSDMALWAEGRKYLEAASGFDAQVDARVFLLRAELEEKSGAPFKEVQNWRSKGAEAPPAPAWVCRVSGRVYQEWQPVALPHGSFNSLVWGDPLSGGALGGGALGGGEVLSMTRGRNVSKALGGFLDLPKSA